MAEAPSDPRQADDADKARFGGLWRSTGANLALNLARAGFGLGQVVIVANVLGPDNWGTYAVASSLVALFQLPITEGAARLPEREIAAAIGRGEQAGGFAALAFSARLVAILSVAACLVLFAGFALHPDLPGGVGPLAVVAASVILSEGAAQLCVGTLRGMGRTVAGAAQVTLRAALGFLSAVLLWAMEAMTLEALFFMRTLAALVVLAALAGFVWSDMPRAWRDRAQRRAQKKPEGATWYADVFDFIVIGFLATGLVELVVLILSLLAGATEAGFFRLGARITASARFVPRAAAQALGPRIAYHYNAGRRAVIERQAQLTALAGGGACLVLLLGLLVLGRFVFGLAFDPPYLAALPVTLILTTGLMMMSFSGPNMVLLRVAGQSRQAMWVSLTALVVGVAACAALAGPFGAVGAAAAVLAADLVSAGLLLHRAQAVTGLRTAPRPSTVAALPEALREKRRKRAARS